MEFKHEFYCHFTGSNTRGCIRQYLAICTVSQLSDIQPLQAVIFPFTANRQAEPNFCCVELHYFNKNIVDDPYTWATITLIYKKNWFLSHDCCCVDIRRVLQLHFYNDFNNRFRRFRFLKFNIQLCSNIYLGQVVI